MGLKSKKTIKTAKLTEALDLIDSKAPGTKKKLLDWFDGDVNDLEPLPLPPPLGSKDLVKSWAYLKGVRETVLKIIPDFLEIHWIETDQVYPKLRY